MDRGSSRRAVSPAANEGGPEPTGSVNSRTWTIDAVKSSLSETTSRSPATRRRVESGGTSVAVVWIRHAALRGVLAAERFDVERVAAEPELGLRSRFESALPGNPVARPSRDRAQLRRLPAGPRRASARRSRTARSEPAARRSRPRRHRAPRTPSTTSRTRAVRTRCRPSPSPDTSTATTCMPSPSEGHPRSPVFVATHAVPSTPGANTPATLVTLHTGNPSPMSSSTPSDGFGGSVCCGTSLVGSGTGCQENPSTSPSTRTSGSDPSVAMAMIDSPATPFSADPYVMNAPSGENWGSMLVNCDPWSVSRRTWEPSASIRKTSDSLIASYRMNTIRDPSGDHAGL